MQATDSVPGRGTKIPPASGQLNLRAATRESVRGHGRSCMPQLKPDTAKYTSKKNWRGKLFIEFYQIFTTRVAFLHSWSFRPPSAVISVCLKDPVNTAFRADLLVASCLKFLYLKVSLLCLRFWRIFSLSQNAGLRLFAFSMVRKSLPLVLWFWGESWRPSDCSSHVGNTYLFICCFCNILTLSSVFSSLMVLSA